MCEITKAQGVIGQHTEKGDEESDSLFLGLMGSPFDGDWTTSFFRLAESVLKQGKQLSVWTCGNSTSITQYSAVRPRDPIQSIKEANTPVYTLAEMVQSLFKTFPGQLRWYVCQYCMEERGATQQIDDVEVLLPFSFNFYLNQSDQALVLGVK